MASTLRCSFCRKSEHEVAKLVAGPGVLICDACVAEASRIMGEPVRRRGLRGLRGIWTRTRRRLARRRTRRGESALRLAEA